MYNRGDILKSKNGISNKTYIMYLDESYVILFDNLSNNIIGDITSGLDLNDFELSNIQEMSQFVINNS